MVLFVMPYKVVEALESEHYEFTDEHSGLFAAWSKFLVLPLLSCTVFSSLLSLAANLGCQG